MSRVIVIDLVGDDEAVKAERKAASESGKSVVWQSPAPALELVEVSFGRHPQDAMPAAYRASGRVFQEIKEAAMKKKPVTASGKAEKDCGCSCMVCKCKGLDKG